MFARIYKEFYGFEIVASAFKVLVLSITVIGLYIVSSKET